MSGVALKRPPSLPAAERDGGAVELAIGGAGEGRDVVRLAPAAARRLGAILLDAGPGPGDGDGERFPVTTTPLPGTGRRFTLRAGGVCLTVAVDRSAGEWLLQAAPRHGRAGPGVMLTDAQARRMGAALIASAAEAEGVSPARR